MYALTNVGSSLLFLLRDLTLMLTELRAASALHNRMLDAIMKAPMQVSRESELAFLLRSLIKRSPPPPPQKSKQK